MPRTSLDRVGNNLRGFSGWVFSQMKAHGMKQIDLARYLNVTQQNISQKMSGKVAWSLRDAFRLYELFGEPYEWR